MEGAGTPIVLWAVFTLAFVHTVVGVDHTLPFVAIGRAQGWSARRTILVTALCGVGHVASSVVLGGLGAALGIAAEHLEWIEGARGDLAAWLLVVFGFSYAAWGLWRSLRGRPHTHVHVHVDGTAHTHVHGHLGEHAHPHGARRRQATAWVLFVVLVLGPCEPLIPLIMAPAMVHDWAALAAVVAIFGLTTIGTMVGLVAALWYGLRAPVFPSLERHVHTVAGLAVAVSGLAVVFLGI